LPGPLGNRGTDPDPDLDLDSDPDPDFLDPR
jgi:hypothetical protein